jgi:DNA polymerase
MVGTFADSPALNRALHKIDRLAQPKWERTPIINQSVLSLDFETRSAINLTKVGAERYARDPTTGVWCAAWAIDDDPVGIWYPGLNAVPHKLLDHIESGGTVSAWNAPFELAIWRHVILRDYPHFPELKIEQLDCTMARSLACSLPGKLEICAEALGIAEQKDKAGHRLMMKMCVPTKAWRDNPVGPPQWHDKPGDLERLGEYCIQDVKTERCARKQIDPLSPRERQTWIMDRIINDRGVRIDIPNVQRALKIVEKEKKRLNKELQQVTGGSIETLGSKSFLPWLDTQGIKLENMKKRRVSRLVRSNIEMTPAARRALEIRLEGAKASTAKLNTMLVTCDEHGICQGLLRYHGTTTGRWAGSLWQPHNLMRPEFPGIDSDEEVIEAVEDCIRLFGDEVHGEDIIRLVYVDPMHAVANCMRGFVIPEDGHEFIGGDFTGIENRMLMWLSNEEWMLEKFREFDVADPVQKKLLCNYKLTYSRSFGTAIEKVTKKQRLIGKVGALACGYAGAVGAYLGMGDNYDMVPGDVAKAAREATPDDLWKRTAERFPTDPHWQFGLDRDTWTGIKIVVDAWRAAHPNVTQTWWHWQDCCIEAVKHKGRAATINSPARPPQVITSRCGRLKFVANQHFLLIRLPSGRYLHYARPSLHEVPNISGEGTRLAVKYYGLDKIRKTTWVQRTLTAQIISENITSGTSRDVLNDAMIRLEERRYPIHLHVHDEAVSQVRKGFGDVKEFEAILCDSKPWLDGLPVAAAAWRGPRFRK